MTALLSMPALERLVAFDSTSRNSNLELIEYVRDHLGSLSVDSHITWNDDRTKANLFATIGPADQPGIMLSGHTDVVPVDGQVWSTEPFVLTEHDGRLYGRGTADMKAFIAICLGFAPEFKRAPLKRPIHFAFSYDEELGCLGVPRLIESLEGLAVKPVACIIGEPTSMRVIRGHKGKLGIRCRVRGLASHSALTHKGVNAVEAAARVVSHLVSIKQRIIENGPFDPLFEPPYTTVHTGTFSGGTAMNIVPAECEFRFEFRHLPEQDPESLLAEVVGFAEDELLPEMRAVCADAGFAWERFLSYPGMDAEEDDEVVLLAKALAGANRADKVGFGTEGGLFQQAGIPSVICGPGSIEQAHKPDEYITLEQLAAGEAFMRRLIAHLC